MPEHRDKSIAEICRHEGWGIFQLVSNYGHLLSRKDELVWASLGLYAPMEAVFKIGTAKFVRNHISDALGIEMLPYHNLGLSQYTALGLDYSLHHIKPPNDAHMEMLRDLIIAADVFCITPGKG